MDDVEKLQVSVRIKLDNKDAQAKIDKMQAQINNLRKSAELKQAKIDVSTSQAQKRIELMQEKLDEMKIRFEAVRRETNKTWFEKAGSLMKPLLDNAKKLAFSLLTVRGIWFAVRKAMTTYLSQNEELQSRLNAIYYGVGSFFAPVLEWIVDKLEYVLAVLNKLKLLIWGSGLEMNKFGKEAQKAKNQLLGFDEINNLTSKQGSGSEFDINKLEEADVSFHKLGAAIGMIVGGLEVLKKIGTIESIKDLIKLGGMYLAFVGFATAIGSFLDYMQDPTWEHMGETISGIGLGILGLGIMFGNLPMIVAGSLIALLGVITAKWDKIKEWWESVKPDLPGWVQQMGDWVIKKLDIFFTKLKEWFDSLVEMIKSFDIAGLIAEILLGLPLRLLGVDMDAPIIQGWNKYDPNDGVPHYDVGTNYVPNDQLAMVHKGEAIIPAKYNNADLYGNVSAEQLNLLSGIYEMVENINRKEFDVSLDGQSMTQKIRTINDQQVARNGGQAFAIAR